MSGGMGLVSGSSGCGSPGDQSQENNRAPVGQWRPLPRSLAPLLLSEEVGSGGRVLLAPPAELGCAGPVKAASRANLWIGDLAHHTHLATLCRRLLHLSTHIKQSTLCPFCVTARSAAFGLAHFGVEPRSWLLVLSSSVDDSAHPAVFGGQRGSPSALW